MDATGRKPPKVAAQTHAPGAHLADLKLLRLARISPGSRKGPVITSSVLKIRHESESRSGGPGRIDHVRKNTSLGFVAEIDVTALKLELERSKIARLRAWAALGELRTVLTAKKRSKIDLESV
jgi:hypothetical protein